MTRPTMPKTEELVVEGLEELDRNLDKVGLVMGGKALRSALMFGSTPMLKAAKDGAPYQDPDNNDIHLRDSLGRSTKILNGGSTVVMRLGERQKKIKTKKGVRKVVYGHLIEFGWVLTSGSTVAAQPFLRPAFDGNVKVFLERFKKKLAKAIDKALSQ